MELTDFYIRQFRDLHEVRLAFSDLTVLIGRNGAGKTSMLAALESLGARVKHFGGTEDLTEWRREHQGAWNIHRDLGVYSIYEVDDDLNGPIVNINENATKVFDTAGEVIPEVPLLRSRGTLNLLAAALAPECFHAFLTVTHQDFGSSNNFALSAEDIEPELERAIALFHCCDVFEAFERARTDPALGEYAKEFFSDDLPWAYRHEKTRVEQGISERGQSELEVADAVRQAAAQLVPIIRSARRFAWTGSGYGGIAVERSEIPEETGKLLTQIADTRFSTLDRRFPLPPFFGYSPTGSELSDSLTFYEQFGGDSWAVDSSMFRGFTAHCSAPVFEIANQWTRRSPLLLARFTPGRAGTTPFRLGRGVDYGVLEGVRASDSHQNLSREEEEEQLSQTSLELGWSVGRTDLIQSTHEPLLGGEPGEFLAAGEFLAVGPPGIRAVGAGNIPEDVETEVEACLPDLHDQLWRRLALNCSLSVSSLQSRQAALLSSVTRRRTQGNPWLWSPGEGTWQVQPTLPATIKLLENAINKVAPAFVGFAGLVTLSLLDVDKWHQGRFIELRYDGKPLERLPAGIARWVATSVRIGGRNLFNSQLVLSRLTAEEEVAAFLEYVDVPDDFDLDVVGDVEIVDRFCLDKRSRIDDEALARAIGRRPSRSADDAAVDADRLRWSLLLLTVMNDPEGWRRFSVSPRPQDRTLLLVDEPELHLHVDAMTDVRNWLSDHLRDTRVNAVVATHSPGFLDYRPDEARIAMVENLAPGHSTVEDITDNVGFWLSEHGEALGTETLDGVLLKRGFLLVEGPHDEIVINHFYGDQLARHRIGIIAMWGFTNTLDLTESRYLRYAGRPIAMLLDNVPEHYGGKRGLTVEETNLKRFRTEFKEASIPFRGEGHGAVDIIFTLPEQAVRRHLASLGIEGTFEGGWQTIQREIRSDPQANNSRAKKRLAQQLLGLEQSDFGLGPGNFIHPVLKACSEDDRPTGTLERAMEKIFDFFANSR